MTLRYIEICSFITFALEYCSFLLFEVPEKLVKIFQLIQNATFVASYYLLQKSKNVHAVLKLLIMTSGSSLFAF